MTTDGHVAELALVQVIQKPGEDFERVVRSLKLTPSFGPIWYTSLDLGTPSADVDSTRIPNDNGEDDRTRFFGARAVAINLTVNDDWFPATGTDLWDQRQNSASYWVRELGRWSSPGFRSWLYVRFNGDSSVYRMDLSGRGQASVITGDGVNREIRAVQMNFSCPSGLLREFSQDTDQSRVTRNGRLRHTFPVEVPGDTGILVAGLTFPVQFPGSSIGSSDPIDYQGTESTGAIFRIYAQAGDFVNPTIQVMNTKTSSFGDDGQILYEPGEIQNIGFQGFTLLNGQYLEIDSEKKTITVNGDPTTTPDKYLIGPLRWPKLANGLNFFQLSQNLLIGGASPSAPGHLSYAECLYYPAFTGV